MTARSHTTRRVRGLALAIILGCCLLMSWTPPGLAQDTPASSAAAVGSPGPEPLPGAATTPSPASRASDDAPPDVRLVFGFTAGTVLVLSALAFLDRRPEP